MAVIEANLVTEAQANLALVQDQDNLVELKQVADQYVDETPAGCGSTQEAGFFKQVCQAIGIAFVGAASEWLMIFFRLTERPACSQPRGQ